MSVRTTARIAASLSIAALLSLVVAPVAGAQTDPYGSTTTTAPVEEVEASCSLSLAQAKAGEPVTATVNGVFFGEHVRILFDGVQVGATTAPDVAGQSTSGAVAFGGQVLAAQADTDTTTVTVTFNIPKAAAGTHIVTAVGDTFTCFCNPQGQFTVLAAAASTGSLVRTGVEAALLIAVAVALLLGGRALVASSRRRRADASLDHDADRDLTTVDR